MTHTTNPDKGTDFPPRGSEFVWRKPGTEAWSEPVDFVTQEMRMEVWEWRHAADNLAHSLADAMFALIDARRVVEAAKAFWKEERNMRSEADFAESSAAYETAVRNYAAAVKAVASGTGV